MVDKHLDGNGQRAPSGDLFQRLERFAIRRGFARGQGGIRHGCFLSRCLDDVQHGLSWEDMHDREERAHANLRAPRQDDLDIN
jgi:hypothetical protein